MKRNINFEEDTRHDVSDKVMRDLKNIYYNQDDLRMSKYNTPLHHSLPYSWLDMGMEEAVDFLKYLQCERDRKEYIIQILEAGMRVDEPKEYIKTALELLTVKGTVK